MSSTEFTNVGCTCNKLMNLVADRCQFMTPLFIENNVASRKCTVCNGVNSIPLATLLFSILEENQELSCKIEELERE